MVSATQPSDLIPPAITVEDPTDAPVKRIDPGELRTFGQKLYQLFQQYVSDRRIAELRWLRNQRQYLGIYDPDIEKEFSVNRSRAYPRLTRVKCISVLSRLMNLMFPGNERNWAITGDPSPNMKIADVQKAIQEAQKADQDQGITPDLSLEYVMDAVKALSNKRAKELEELIDDQLQELGGHQSYDYIALNRKVIQSGVLYGMGVLRGPFVRQGKATVWKVDPQTGQPTPKVKTVYKPMFEFLPVWDFYPDLSAKTFEEMDGYFTRVVMSRHQVRDLAMREDFLSEVIKKYLRDHPMGNYRPQPFETELRAMGVRVNVNEMKTETSKYEVICWHGPVSGLFLQMGGVDVPSDKLQDDMDAEIWMLDGNVIKCILNPWKELGVEVKTLHTFLFDEDDTSPVGFGLPNAIRDSQMAVSAATRMLLDNASVVCGPNLEVNTDLLRPDQDISSTSAYKIWYRTGEGIDAQWPAVRNLTIDSHLPDLQEIINMFMKFADAETFVGPATGGDMSQAPSEPMRTAAGASMLRGDAALPFKDIVRAFDQFTQSVIDSCVRFNQKFNPDQTEETDYNVIARGATSLIAKEIRGMQIDNLVLTIKPEEMVHVDERKLVEARFKSRDLEDLLVTKDEAGRRMQAQNQQAAQQAQQAQEMAEAQVRKILSDAFKNITQAQKNSALADAASVDAALKLLEQGLTNGNATGAPGEPGADQTPPSGTGQPGGTGGPAGPGLPPPGNQGSTGGMPPGESSDSSGGGQGLQ